MLKNVRLTFIKLFPWIRKYTEAFLFTGPLYMEIYVICLWIKGKVVEHKFFKQSRDTPSWMECMAAKLFFYYRQTRPTVFLQTNLEQPILDLHIFYLRSIKTRRNNKKTKNKNQKPKILYLSSHFILIRRRTLWGSPWISLPFLDLLGVNNMVAVYTKRRLPKKQTNKENTRLARMARLTQRNLCISDQPNIFESDRSKSFWAVSIFLLSGLGPQVLALLDSCPQHRCSHQAEWSGQNIPRRLLGSHVHRRPQTMDGPESVENLNKD